jgi:radical SAM superfamily enzyme YgiQ (UPF0313 family)
MSRTIPTILLVNPWIYDFAAYDFWNKPLGLLSIGSLLQRLGYEVHLLDCLHRFDPETADHSAVKADGTGKYHREIIEKPAVLADVSRNYCRYGLPVHDVEERLARLPQPDVILVTSFMTYWYPAAQEMVRLLRRCFPAAKIMLGGIYATLCADHARPHIQPDALIQGEGESAAIRQVAAWTGGPGRDFSYGHLDDLPYTPWELYATLESAAILTTRGCPFRCSYCASKLLNGGFRRRSLPHVIGELDLLWRRKTKHIAFFDDALLHQADRHIKPILRQVISRGYGFSFHTPNGLHIRDIDLELAELMRNSGFQSIRLSFESADPARQQNKVNNDALIQALHNLEHAGFDRAAIGVYLLMGLADQEEAEVRRSIDFVHGLGARIFLASFSPIPGTLDEKTAIDAGWWSSQKDLLLGNNSLFPIWREKYGLALCEEIVNYAREKNKALL